MQALVQGACDRVCECAGERDSHHANALSDIESSPQLECVAEPHHPCIPPTHLEEFRDLIVRRPEGMRWTTPP